MQAENEHTAPASGRWWAGPVVSLLTVMVVFALVEGVASIGLAGLKMKRSAPRAAWLNTEYHEELGWISKAGFESPDMYGPGVYLRTNAQRFRGPHYVEHDVPAGKVRIVCSGDSFTLGVGVDDDHTWCSLLAATDERLQTVNIGLGGYGVDQSYLWYLRVKDSVEHDLHLFAFITADFARMENRVYHGYGKPFLELENGRLVVNNVPVPRTPGRVWMQRLLRTARELAMSRFARRLFHALKPTSRGPRAPSSKSRALAVEIIRRLQELHRENGSILVLVHLPVRGDYLGEYSSSWRSLLLEESESAEWIYVDLIEDVRKLPAAELDRLYLQADEVPDFVVPGHYSEDGNAFVAEALHRRLQSIPEVAARLSSG